jgi:hypothetical protein
VPDDINRCNFLEAATLTTLGLAVNPIEVVATGQAHLNPRR